MRAKIEYFKNTLTVLFHNGMSNNEKDFEMCIRAENVVLPKNGYFGVSAATGGLADDHDVLKLVTHSLRSPDMALTPDHVNQEVFSFSEFNFSNCLLYFRFRRVASLRQSLRSSSRRTPSRKRSGSRTIRRRPRQCDRRRGRTGVMIGRTTASGSSSRYSRQR